MTRLSPLAYLLAACFLAGCVGTDAPEAQSDSELTDAPEAQFDDTTGAVTGTITDAELAPVAEAAVQLSEPALETRSDTQGRFTFNHVPPGEYTLLVAKLGFTSTGRKVAVTAGQVTSGVNLQLAPLPVIEPYVELSQFRGFITCSVGYALVLSEECGEGIQNPVGGPIGRDPNNHIDWKFNVTTTENLNAMYLELTWRPASAAAQQLAFNIAHGFTCIPSCSAKITYPECGAFENYGPPVVTCYLPADGLGIKDVSKDLPWDITARAWAAPSPETQSPNLVLQQAFTMYRTDFYGQEKPEGYSAVTDA